MFNSPRNQIKKFDKSTNWRVPALIALGALAASAWVVRSKTRQVEHDHPPTGKFIEVDGVRLHYVERGTGQTVVLLHGNGVMAEDFEISGFTELAAARYRVIAFDRPGYGYSERPRDRIWTPIAQAKLLHDALQKLGVERPIVLGHSWGTLVALAMALEFPQYVRGLVLLSGYYYPSLRLDAPLSASPAIPIVGDLLRYTASPLLGRMMWPAVVKKLFSPSTVPARFTLFPAWMSLRPSQLRASAGESGLMIPSTMTLCKRYHELAMPIAVIAGNDDRIVNAQHNSSRLHRELSNSELRLSPGVGHMVHYAVPEEIIAAIDSVKKMAELQPMTVQTAVGAESTARQH